METLSGGQRQGVAVARAAAFGSKVIILDEPTASLGVKESRRVLELILDVKSRGIPIILISHNMPHVFEVADRIHVHRLGRRLVVIDPKSYSMSDAVALMTEYKPPEAQPRHPKPRLQPPRPSAKAPPHYLDYGQEAQADGLAPDALAAAVARQLPAPDSSQRQLIAIAGPPASGKSTLAQALVARLNVERPQAALLPMDGFHLDNGLLETRGLLARKGAAETFDLAGFRALLARTNKGEPLYPHL